MADSSFDIVSKLDRQEVDNAVNQTAKEIANRYDFRGVDAAIRLAGDVIEMEANSADPRCPPVQAHPPGSVTQMPRLQGPRAQALGQDLQARHSSS